MTERNVNKFDKIQKYIYFYKMANDKENLLIYDYLIISIWVGFCVVLGGILLESTHNLFEILN